MDETERHTGGMYTNNRDCKKEGRICWVATWVKKTEICTRSVWSREMGKNMQDRKKKERIVKGEEQKLLNTCVSQVPEFRRDSIDQVQRRDHEA